mmetsp:Transcript_23815/g.57422  ORF Transcript_23815/g.57422 Transcript_23815/m.57422 type:complete len:154 (-) Transcript_23815:66-527(-)
MALIVDFPHRLYTSSDRKSRVSFDHHIYIKVFRKNSAADRSKLWYSNKEIKSFSHQAASILSEILSVMTMAQYAEINAGDTSAFLGFESYLFRSGCRSIKQRREALRSAILVEQDRQIRLGISDPDAFVKVSEGLSSYSQRRAQLIGLIHAEK